MSQFDNRELHDAIAAAMERFRQAAAECPEGPRPAPNDWPAPGVPWEFQAASFRDHETGCLKAAKGFLADGLPRRCLVLAGSTGRGKSWAAAAALRSEPSHSRRFVHWPGFHRDWRSFGARGDAARELLRETRFLAFDDVGCERPENAVIEPDPLYDEVFGLLRAHGKTVIVTTNLVVDRFFGLVTDRVLSRLRGDWGAFFSATDEPDYRFNPLGGPR